jgi:hypothetical protein
MPIKGVRIGNNLTSERVVLLGRVHFSRERSLLATITLLRWKIFILGGIDDPGHALQFAESAQFGLQLVSRRVDDGLGDHAAGRVVISIGRRIFGWLSVGYDVVGVKRVAILRTGRSVGVEHA